MSEYTNLISHYRNKTKIYKQKIVYAPTALTKLGSVYFNRHFDTDAAAVTNIIINIPLKDAIGFIFRNDSPMLFTASTNILKFNINEVDKIFVKYPHATAIIELQL